MSSSCNTSRIIAFVTLTMRHGDTSLRPGEAGLGFVVFIISRGLDPC